MKNADQFKTEADAKRKGGFFGNFFNSKEDRDNEAKELYKQAANCYKAGGDRDSAIDCLLLCVQCEPEPQPKASYLGEAA